MILSSGWSLCQRRITPMVAKVLAPGTGGLQGESLSLSFRIYDVFVLGWRLFASSPMPLSLFFWARLLLDDASTSVSTMSSATTSVVSRGLTLLILWSHEGHLQLFSPRDCALARALAMQSRQKACPHCQSQATRPFAPVRWNCAYLAELCVHRKLLTDSADNSGHAFLPGQFLEGVF